MSLWASESKRDWQAALARYDEVIARQGVKKLPELDRWYRNELPAAIAARQPAHLTYDELVKLTEWKMARGVWRARNLALVKGNAEAAIVEASRRAFSDIPHPSAPIKRLIELAGVGPATASAVLAAAAPAVYAFLDDIVAAQVPALGRVDYTASYYARYAAALRERATRLGEPWTPALVERALWAHAGGKAGAR